MEIKSISKDGNTDVFLNDINISDSLSKIEFSYNADMCLPKVLLEFYPVDTERMK